MTLVACGFAAWLIIAVLGAWVICRLYREADGQLANAGAMLADLTDGKRALAAEERAMHELMDTVLGLRDVLLEEGWEPVLWCPRVQEAMIASAAASMNLELLRGRLAPDTPARDVPAS